jgi:hypothetical protein
MMPKAGDKPIRIDGLREPPKNHKALAGALLVLSLWMAIGVSAWAQTSPSTVKFLTKLNGYYYCLSRVGVDNYSCDLTCTLSAKSASLLKAQKLYDPKFWKAMEGFRYSVVDMSGLPVSIMGVSPAGTGNAAFDSKVSDLNLTVLMSIKNFFDFWKALVVEPLYDPNDLKQGNLKLVTTADGFQVVQSSPSGDSMTGIFDKKGKLLQFVTVSGKNKTTVEPAFTYTAKGYLLRGLRIMGVGVSQTCVIDYGVQGKFWMPKTFNIQVQVPGVTRAYLEILYTLTNYRINQ